MGDWPDSLESDGISSSLSWVRGAALRRMGQSTSLRGLQPPSIQGSALKRRDSFLQEEEGNHSLSSLSSLASSGMGERAGSTDTFTVNLLPASNPKFFLPPIDSDLAASSSSAVKKMRKISKVAFSTTQNKIHPNFLLKIYCKTDLQVSNKEKPWKQQEDLADTVIRGELERMEDIVEVPVPSDHFSFNRLIRLSWHCMVKKGGI